MSTPSQEKLKCPIKINFDPLNGPVDTEEEVAVKWEAIKQWYRDHPEAEAPVVSYWAQVSFLKQTGMSGHKARRIAYRRVFGKGDAT